MAALDGSERADSRLLCRSFRKETADPVWETVIDGIVRADSVLYRDGILYVQTVRVELP